MDTLVNRFERLLAAGYKIGNSATWARGYKTFFFILNSAENEICSAYKNINTNNLNFFSLQNRAEHESFPANEY